MVCLLAGSLAAFGSSFTVAGAGTRAVANQVPLNARQTLVWAIQGGTSNAIGSEGLASKNEVSEFEKAYPNIKVSVVPLSEDADTARATIDRDFLANSSTPDVIDASTDWIGEMANAGFIESLNNWGLSGFLPGAVASTSFNGKLYAALWYYNAEGLYYRKDLIKTPPKTPMQLVSDAMSAMKSDPKLKEGLAIEGNKYEGFVTVFIDLLRALRWNVSTPLTSTRPRTWQRCSSCTISSTSTRSSLRPLAGWQEGQTDNAFQAGQAAFETNWPYVQQEDYVKSSSFPLEWQERRRFRAFPDREWCRHCHGRLGCPDREREEHAPCRGRGARQVHDEASCPSRLEASPRETRRR